MKRRLKKTKIGILKGCTRSLNMPIIIDHTKLIAALSVCLENLDHNQKLLFVHEGEKITYSNNIAEVW